MNWTIDNKVAFHKGFVRYLVSIGFTADEAFAMTTTDPELHYMMMRIKMCFSVGANYMPTSDIRELS